MKKYWYQVCPHCHGQGRLMIWKDTRDGMLFFACDECLRAWNKADDIGNQDKVFLSSKMVADFASETDINEAGWRSYAVNEYHR